MNLGLEGKSALVVGASRGLGRAIALGLAAEGAQVGVVGRTAADITSLVAEMSQTSHGHWGLARDLMPDNAPTQFAQDLQSYTDRVDILVHNLGGTLGVRDPFCSVDEWRAVWRLNFEIAAELNRCLVPAMQQRQWGRVVHISSIAATLSRGSVAYCAVKAALNAYTKNLGCTVAPDGVVISAVMPGVIRHPGSHWDQVAINDPDRVQNFLNNRIAIQRFAAPSEISNMVIFLCSEQAAFMPGAVVPIDGGSW
ncbi:MAG: SDR family oxidoreductase [Cyanobacteria bacterium]|nr:SDR family oxidoreductase [Cyanobacteriota bacterium]MDW8202336.1 SDR family oxidoreductase [Cyanobacteriota bacterium SKYGB_h_bin112]